MEVIERDFQNLTTCPVHVNLEIRKPPIAKTNYFIVTLFLLVVLRILVKIVFQNKRKSGNEKRECYGLDIISGPKPFFINFIGNLYHLLPLKETLSKALHWHNAYGSCIKFIGASHTALVVFSAEIAQPILKSGDWGHVSKESTPFYENMRPYLGNGILIAESAHWQTRRKTLTKCMNFQSLRSYTKLLNKHSKRFVNTLEKLFVDKVEQPINFQINCSFLAIITEIVTGSDIQDVHEVAEYHHNAQIWKECMPARVEKPWCLLDIFWRFHPKYKMHNDAVDSMNSFSKRRMREHKLRKQCEKNVNADSKNEADFNADPEDSNKFRSTLDDLVDDGVSDEELVHELNALLFGGHETSATTIHFFFFIMASHPHYQESCRREIDQVFEDPFQAPDGNLTFEALAGLKYVERCLLETMRLYPSGFAIMRNLKKSLTIDYEGKQVDVPAGTNVVIVPWVIHRNTDYYPNPEEFDPDRFLPEECAKRHPYAYLAFSAGPRNCIGWKFGMNEMKTAAAYVIRNFRLSTTDKLEDVTLLPNVTLTPQRDYNFMLEKRIDL